MYLSVSMYLYIYLCMYVHMYECMHASVYLPTYLPICCAIFLSVPPFGVLAKLQPSRYSLFLCYSDQFKEKASWP